MIISRTDQLMRKIHGKPISVRVAVFCTSAVALATFVQAITKGL